MHVISSTLFCLHAVSCGVLLWQLAALLSIVPIISASPLTPSGPIIPEGWISLGCFTDNIQIPTLTAWGCSKWNMTVELCVDHCISEGLAYAGLENGTECYCGNVLSIIAMNATETDCNMPCAGDPTEMCGSDRRLNLFWNSTSTPSPPPTMVQSSSTGLWDLRGCYNDSNSLRVLEELVDIPGGPFNTSVESCTNACYDRGFVVAGLEWAWQCFCGHNLAFPGVEMPEKDCALPCSGNQSEICGGADRMTVYYYVTK